MAQLLVKMAAVMAIFVPHHTLQAAVVAQVLMVLMLHHQHNQVQVA
jgi:hypothetical protein